MKYSGVCTKCRASDIVRIPGQTGAYGSGNNIQIGVWSTPIPVSRYVCLNCGFAEEWVDAPQHLAKLREKFGPTSRQ
ncbi:hypothetical protein ACFO1B_23815 [Dactylosporangium siamense]|uniref:Uncharacterized protein n=1 Tax=Dactylosporangium siamense TaxID=685454 RepID=A0A919PRT1_9ACTN|nr:hypothetical protein [Dactylosporangium siamense]GIG47228.1 hypothetical protein Dsi01nite_052690 [Dactylosporangium siamense]